MPPLALDSVATLTPLARWMSDPARVPRVSLTTLPTPVAPLERLAQASGIASLWIKRDDATGTLYGGNKPRKLELLLGAARARGRERVPGEEERGQRPPGRRPHRHCGGSCCASPTK